MRRILAFLATGLLMSQAFAATYFVATDGNDSNSGTSEGAAWLTVGYAASQVSAGDTVYVKAGTYSSDRISLSVSGTDGNPISFIGYKTTPGDVTDNDWSYPGNTALDPNDMPVINGGDRSSGDCVNFTSESYITIKNFYLTGCVGGVYAGSGSFAVIDNVVARDLGNLAGAYSGRGIVIGSNGHDSSVNNVVIYNTGAEGISVIGNRNTVTNSKVYADDDQTGVKSSMDYYIIVWGDDNVIDDNYVERVNDITHQGHGIGIKQSGTRNVFRRNTAVDIAGNFYVRHRNVVNNLFEDNVAIGSIGILIRDGASDNTFNRTYISDSLWGIAYMDTSEDPVNTVAGHDNVISNTVIEDNTGCVINYSKYGIGYATTGAEDNEISYATIVNAPALYCSERPNQGNLLTNAIVTDVASLTTSDSTQPLNDSIRYSNFWNVGFPIPDGEGNLSVAPDFLAPAGGNYRLTETSLLVDAGIPVSGVMTDMAGAPRPQGQGIDIGAYEFATVADSPPKPPIIIE